MKCYVDKYLKFCLQLSVDNKKSTGHIKLLRSIYLVLVMTLVSYINFGQTKPLILKGKFDNCPVGQIYITFKTGLEETVPDSIKINRDGSFFYKTFKCRVPQSTHLYNLGFSCDLLVAPGYEMTITGNAKDYKTLVRTTSITGIGSGVNRYSRTLALLYFAEIESGYNETRWMDSSLGLPAIDSSFRVHDSVLNEVFNHCTDPYALFFKKMEYYNNLFNRYSGILKVAIYSKYDYATFINFVNRHIPTAILKTPGNDNYLSSEDYLRFFLDSYVDYLQEQAIRKDKEVLQKDPGFLLKEIARSFKGKTREAIFYQRYDRAIQQSESLDKLISTEKELYPYVKMYVTGNETKNALQKRYSDKYAYYISTTIGMSAPAFTLPDEKDIIHSLSDYIGKVVYIDFWGSWCHPCRAETPSMKKIVQQYLNDNRLQIISIDGFDTKKDWIQALKEDQPGWLQLRDETGKLNKDYNTWSVPRFAIIDKKGKIVSLDALKPSNAKNLMRILDQEMSK